jgi:curved DNA-binding protein CbpA
MKNRRNYYRILQVAPDASTQAIKASRRTLMQGLKMHPDLGGDHMQAVLINEAFATLSDPDRRAAYDRALEPTAKPASKTEPRSPSDQADPQHATPPPPGPTLACGFCAAACAAASFERPESMCSACGSALFPARKHQASDSSRRTLARLSRSMPMTFRRSASRRNVWSGTTEDVSLNGLRFTSQLELRAGERLSIACEFCSAVAIVRSVRVDHHQHGQTRWQVGVEFSTLRLLHVRGGLFSTLA